MVRNNDELTCSLRGLFNKVKAMSAREQEVNSLKFYERNLSNSFGRANSYEHPAWKDGLNKHGYVPGSRNANRYARMEAIIKASEEAAIENRRQRQINRNKPKGGLLAQLFGLNRVAFAY